MRDRGSTRRCVRFLFGCRKLFRAERGVMRQSFVKRETEDHIAAFIAAVADRVFPFLLVIVVLLFGPGLAGREQNGFRIRGPGKGVYFFVTRGDGKGLAAVGRNQKELGDVFLLTFVFTLVLILARFSFVVARVGAIAGFGRIAFGKERDPLAIGRPLWRSVVARLRQLRQGAAGSAGSGSSIEPQIFAVNLLLPVGSLGLNDDRGAVRRNFHGRKANRVKEFVERNVG